MYAYCNNNPIKYIDPSGQIAIVDDLLIVATALLCLSLLFLLQDATHEQALGKAFSGAVEDITDVITGANDSTDSKAEEKEDVVVQSPKNQAYFPENPDDFNPRGLIRADYPGTSTGKIIKWADPVTKIAVFEWDEDLKRTPHYHILINGKHIGDQRDPNTLIEEPWNSIYFGE